MKDMDNLKQQVMVNQFMFATGCQLEQANQFLVAAKWQFEVCIFHTMQKSKMALVYLFAQIINKDFKADNGGVSCVFIR